MMTDMTLRATIERLSDELTASERKLATALLSDYPFAGLETIQSLAERTRVSAPSITRFVNKIGCRGYQEFQRTLIAELKEGQRSPVDLHNDDVAVREGFLPRSLSRSADMAASVADAVTSAQFERVCAMLQDDKRSVFVLGGRISDPIAQLLSRHLWRIRREVFHMSSDHETWPEHMLRMRPRDVLVLVDFRRYQRNLAELAKIAAARRGAQVVLITDKWISPIAKSAGEVLAVPIESGTAWDSYVGAVALIEAMIAWIAEQDWDGTRRRIEAWDSFRLGQGASEHDT